MSIFKVFLFTLFLLTVGQCGNIISSTTEDSSNVSRIEKSESWVGVDKGIHLVGSMIVTVGCGIVLQNTKQFTHKKSAYFGLGISFALGVGKEYSDSQHENNHFSFKDLTANIIGSLIGTVLLLQD